MVPITHLILLIFLLLLMLLSHKDYTTGFFLTRYEIHSKSSSTLSPSPQYSKIILLLVDALRFDFITQTNSTFYYSNQLTTIHTLLSTKPDNSLLFTLLSDPPTVTMQRIKALATGSLPTFIDFKDNLQSESISEDNLIYQAQVNKKKTLFVGDQIWVFLLPNSFTLAYPYDSHNVRDLDTVDQGVISKFRQHMNESWDLMIGHMLGVDHAAHRYNANHKEMARKLQEVNEFIKEIVDSIEENALLLVIGDHGMTEEGNHGGATDNEIQTGLFAYSKQKFNNFSLKKRTVLTQIDVVPTISVLLGVPIPFNNLGTIIPELFKDKEKIELSLYLNAQQVSQYLQVYDSTVKKLPDKEYEKLQGMFLDIEKKFKEGEILFEEIFEFIEAAGRMCRGIWTTFDYKIMTKGAVNVILGTVSMVLFCIYTTQVISYKEIGIALVLAGINYTVSWVFILYTIHKRALLFNFNKSFFMALLINAMHGYTLFSDSYIIKQDQTVRFLSQLILGYSSLTNYSHFHLISSLCIRLSSTFDIFSQTSNPSLLYSSALTSTLPLILLFYLKHKLIYRINLTLVFLYFTFDIFNSQILPKVVYLLFAFSLFYNKTKWNVIPVLIILSGIQSPVLFVLAIGQIWASKKVLKDGELYGTFVALSANQYFYATGHRCNIQSLRISSAFIGFDEYNFWINGVLLSLNTLTGYFLVLSCKESKEIKYFMIHYCVAVCCTLLNTFVNGRHLMVWSIFAPKFIFDGIVFYVTWGFCLLVLFSRIRGVKKE